MRLKLFNHVSKSSASHPDINHMHIPSMTLRQLPRLPRLLNRKPSRPIRALQVLKSIHRNPTRTRSKLQQSTLLLRIPTADTLPKVLDNFIILSVSTVIGVLLPIFNINIGDSANEKFEFALVKDIDEVGGDEFVKASDEGVELFGDSFLDAPFGD